MSNFVFYDFETSSSNKYWGQIIQIGAILTNDNLEELDRFDSRCRLSPGIIPEAMALIVNKTSPNMLKKSNLSHYEMIRQFVETLKRWAEIEIERSKNTPSQLTGTVPTSCPKTGYGEQDVTSMTGYV